MSKTFSEYLSEYKNKHSSTNEELAACLDVSVVTVSNWLNAKRSPDLKDSYIINKVAQLTGEQPKTIMFSIIEQCGIDMSPSDTVTVQNSYYKYFEDFSPFEINDYLFDEEEAKAFVLYNEQDDLFSSNSDGYFILYLLVEKKINHVVLNNVCKKTRKMNSKTAQFIYDYLKNGHSFFDPKCLTKTEFAVFLMSAYPEIAEQGEVLASFMSLNELTEKSYEIQETAFQVNGLADDITLDEIVTDYLGSIHWKKPYDSVREFGVKAAAIRETMQTHTDIVIKYIYGTEIIKYDPKEIEEYNAVCKSYQEEMATYEKKMERIRELQELYNNKETYPDLPVPVPPKKPDGKKHYVLSKLGKKVLEMYKLAYPDVKKRTNGFKKLSPNYRYLLEPHINNWIVINAVYASLENDHVILRDVYIDDDYICDHLHVYKGHEIIEKNYQIGERIQENGRVYEYTSNDLSNLGIEFETTEEKKERLSGFLQDLQDDNSENKPKVVVEDLHEPFEIRNPHEVHFR